MVYITRIEHFNAAHKLFNPSWSKEKNEDVFGKCANENWHGHNFELYVTVKGVPDKETGFVFDAKKLSVIIKDHVTDLLDHKNLNVDVEFMKGKICSIENLIIGIWGGQRRIYAANKFLLYTLTGSLLMLVAIIGVYLRGAAPRTFDIVRLLHEI